MTDQKEGASSHLLAVLPEFGVAVIVTVALWWSAMTLLPPLDGMADVSSRLVFTMKCLAVTALITLLAGVEAVAHERLMTAAFDPLANKESIRLLVNLRYLGNTLEQFVLLVPAVLVLAVYCNTGALMRAVVAALWVWIAARYAFWIGYHYGPRHRVAGLVGQAQTMLILLFVSVRFGQELAGAWGAALPLLVFSMIEVVILISIRQRGRRITTG